MRICCGFAHQVVPCSQSASPTAGPMTMYRGEGVNHGILDAFLLAQTISSIMSGQAGEANAAVRAGLPLLPRSFAWCADRGIRAQLKKYESDLCKRRQFSIPLSYQACVDGHTMPTPDSPLVNLYEIPTDELARAMALCGTSRKDA